MDKQVMDCVTQAEKYLSLREHNESEITEKLKNKGFSEDIICKAILFLKDENELSEERYIRAFISSGNRRHPEGRAVVFQRLLQKRADRELSKQVIEEVYTEEYTLEILESALKKVLKKTSDPIKVRQDLIKSGFPINLINRLISEAL